MPNIPMTRTPNDELPDYDTPGQFCIRTFESGEMRIVFNCPRRRGLCSVPFRPAKLQNGASWDWDGNADKPTVTPSINCVGGCGWHGWIRDGHLVEC